MPQSIDLDLARPILDAMRDIRADLRERLESLDAERQKLRNQLTALDAKERGIRVLLNEEEERWEKIQPTLPMTNGHGSLALPIRPPAVVERWQAKTDVSRFLQRALSDSMPHALAELVQNALEAHVNFKKKHPGRVLHFALTGLAANHWVERVAEGEHKSKWQLVPEERIAPERAANTSGA